MHVSRMPGGAPEIFASIQGEGITCGVPSVFVRLAVCNLQCSWCFVPDTPVLLPDWSCKRIQDLAIGDMVMAVERPRPSAHLRLTPTTVTRVLTRDAQTVNVNGALSCTPDHRFWIADGENLRTHSGWRAIDRAVGRYALFSAEPVGLNQDEKYERGWLAGMADGDGCFWTLPKGYRRFRLALKDESLLHRTALFARRAGYTLRPGEHVHNGFGVRQTMACLWLTVDAEARAFEQWLAEDLEESSWWAGYLGGILDAEGTFSHAILRISQYESSTRTRRRIERALAAQQIRYTSERRGYYIHRSRGQAWRALSLARPHKRSLLEGSFGHHPHARRLIEAVEPTGRTEPIINLTTTAGSFIAAGYVVKNCDTKYTWDWSTYDPKAEIISLDSNDVARRVTEQAGATIRNVVLTGGEPLLQGRELVALADRLKTEGFRIEVETNGTVLPTNELGDMVDQWNVSPKLENSGNRPAAREVPRALEWFARNGNAYWKFVVVSPEDLEEVVRLIDCYRVPRDRVFLMPEGTAAEVLSERSRWLAQICQEKGFRLSTRLHVLLWGTTRGR